MRKIPLASGLFLLVVCLFEYTKSGSGYNFCYAETDLFGQRTGYCWHWNQFDGKYVEFFD